MFGLFSLARFQVWERGEIGPGGMSKRWAHRSYMKPAAQTSWGSWSKFRECACGEYVVGYKSC